MFGSARTFAPWIAAVSLALGLVLGAAAEVRADATCSVGGALTEPLEGQTCNGDLTIVGGTTSTLGGDGVLTVTGNLTLEVGATLDVVGATTFATIDVGGDLDLGTNATIALDGTSGVTEPSGTGGAGRSGTTLACAGSGAGHGGAGGVAGNSTLTIPGGSTYGVPELAFYPGSKGGDGTLTGGTFAFAGGDGGGSVRVLVGGLTTLDGLITADGLAGTTSPSYSPNGGSGGGGSGGSVYLKTADLTTNNPASVHIQARGGKGGDGDLTFPCSVAGGGGGGRITVYYSGTNGAGGSALSTAANLRCTGGAKGTGRSSAAATNGAVGSCLLAQTGAAPQVDTVTPDTIGQGASNRTLTIEGSGFVDQSRLQLDGASPGLPANGITVESVSVVSTGELTAVVSVDQTADASAGANPKLVQVLNPDLSVSPDQFLLTVTPSPEIDHVEQGGSTVTGLPRGFSGTIVIFGTGIQTGTTVSFGAGPITVTSTPTANVAAQSVTLDVSVSTTATAGPVAFTLANTDGGVTETPGSLDVLSQPVISSFSPSTLIVGQTEVPVTVTGSGFIAASQVVSESADVTVESVTFDSFTQLTAVLTVAVESSLTPATRALHVDNGDGGVSPSANVTLQAVPAGLNQADLAYSDGTTAPKNRFWNGFGWSVSATDVGTLPEAPEWLVTRAGRTAGDLLVAAVDATRRLHLRERVGTTFGTLVGPVSVSAAPGRPVDVAAVDGAGGERFLAVYGQSGSSTLTFRMFGGAGATGTVPATDAACTGGTEVSWVRLVASDGTDNADKAVLAYAPDNGALCAVTWTAASGFDAASEVVLAAPGTLATLTTMAFDATFWRRTPPQRGMVAWAIAGSTVPGYALWDGSAWTTGSALNAASAPTETLVGVRLASSALSDRVALGDVTDAGELFVQLWGGDRWGATSQGLPFGLVTTPSQVAGATAGRAFDVTFPRTSEAVTAVYGLTADGAPKTRRWTPTAGWTAQSDLDAPAGAQAPAWVQLRHNPGGADLLVGVLDGAGALTYTAWDGVAWGPDRTLGTGAAVTGEAFMADWRASSPPAAPVVSDATYGGVSPAAIGAQSTGQIVDVTGTGFVNVPTVTFSDSGITATAVSYVAPSEVRVTVDIGAVTPGTYDLTLTNPDGQSATLVDGIQVLPPPASITVRLGAGAPACTPTVTGAAACAFQTATAVPVEVLGTGFVSGATVTFEGTGVDFVGPAVLGVDGAQQVLSGTVNVAGIATPGAGDVRVTNPDSSTGTGTGVFEARSFVAVTSVTPAALGAGARDASLTVQGTNFQSGATFDLGTGVTVNSTTLSGTTQATLVVDVATTAPAGAHTVTANNADGGTGSNASVFSVTAAPTVTSVSPDSGDQGTTVHVTVTGTGLSPLAVGGGVALSGTGIAVSGITATATQLEFDATIAANAAFAQPRDLTITRADGGKVVVTRAFSVIPVPVLIEVTPDTLTAGEIGRVLTITGTGFDPGAVVVIDAGITIHTQTVTSSSQIDLTLDVGAGTGTFDLVVANPGGQTSAPFTLTVVAPAACTVSSGTVTWTPDGTAPIVCSTLTVSGGATLVLSGDLTLNVLGNADITGATLVPAPASTYVRLVVGGNLTVDAGSLIDANGTGFPGGRYGADGEGPGGGAASSGAFTPDDSGRGGGYGGHGGDDDTGGGGATYDIEGLCTDPACFEGVPLNMGSGGGSAHNYYSVGSPPEDFWRAGGNGGGAVVLEVAGTTTIDGTVRANGTAGAVTGESILGNPSPLSSGRTAGGGSGGAVLVLANGGLAGTGAIQARGGNSSPVAVSPAERLGTGGGGGRVAVYYGGANTYTGSLTCNGGTSNNGAASYQGEDGTCFTAARSTITSLTPDVVPQGASANVTFQGTGLVAGDGVIDPAAALTWTDLAAAGPDFTSTVTASTDAPLGRSDVVIRHADDTGTVAFEALGVVANVRVFSLTPDLLAQGDAAAVVVSGALMEPVGATVTFLRNGVEPQCGGSPCVAATVNTGASTGSSLSLNVTVDAAAPIGGYDVRVQNASGGVGTGSGVFTVVSTDGSVPALTAVSPNAVGEGTTDFPVSLSGYDFGVPGSFALDTPTTSDAAVTLAFDPVGCPLTPSTCVTDPAALQHVEVLVTTVGATAGTAVDVSISAGGPASTLPGGLTITARPQITGFTPTEGESTFTLTVSGNNFQEGAVVSLEDSTVTVGSTTASGADLQAQVTVGALTATGVTSVRVTNPDGGFFVLGDLTLNPPPTVTAVGPPSALGVGQSATIVVQGTHFHPSASVSFGADITVSNVVWTDSGHIQVLATVNGGATPGTRTVSVTNPNGGAGSLAAGFTISRPVVLTSISPNVVGAGGTHVLLLQGAQMASTLGVGNIVISGTGVTKSGLFNYRATQVGDVTITSVDLLISIGAGAATGQRTLTVLNPDGSQSSGTFTITPAPVVSFVDPSVAVRNGTVPVSATISGFNFDPVAPRVCFGAGCDFGTSSSTIHVLSATAVQSSRIDVVLQIDNTTTLGLHPVTVTNPDGGTVTKGSALQVVAAFTIGALSPDNEVQVGASGVARTLSGTGFNNTSAPQVAFLTASGAVDTDITVGTTFTGATALDLTISAAGTAAPGLRAVRVTNGDGSVVEKDGVLLVTHPTGPTIGAVTPGTLGLDAAGTRSVTGMTVTGSGLDGANLTLGFDRTGLTVSNVAVAGGGKSATFDLDLASATVPGFAALTATTSAGTDTRAAALRVNAAPVVTAFQPVSLTPGTSNASVLISGGGFQDGAEVSVSPAASGLTVRDLDTLTAGTQANFLSASTLRTVLTTSATASGTFTLTVTNPDGGQGSGPFPVGAAAEGTPARMAYLTNSATTALKVRDFSGGVLQPVTSSNSAALPHSATVTDLWTELRANPIVPGEYLLAVGKAQKFTSVVSNLALYRTIAAGDTWQSIDAVGALSSTTTQAFDLAYEQTGPGRALMVYGVGTTLLFKTIEAGGSSGAAAVTVGGGAPLGTGTPVWVRLIPEPGGRRILVMYMTASRHIQALMWDGAASGGTGAFVSQYDNGGLPLTINAVVPEATALSVLKRGFDGAWEGTTGRAVAFYSQNGSNVLQAVTWDPATGWGTPTASSATYSGTGPTFVEAEADPGSDRILVLAQSDNGVRRPLVARFYLDGWETDITTLASATNYRESTYSRPGRNFDAAWDDDGGLVVVYDDIRNLTNIFYESELATRTWKPAVGWSVPVEIQFDHQIVGAVELEGDPESAEILGLVNTDTGDGLNVQTRFMRWTGNGWGDPSLIATGGVHFMEVGDPFSNYGFHYGTALALAYREDHVPPAAPVIAQTGAGSTTATIQWTAPGDNGTQGTAGGYDIRWSALTIVDDASVADCGAPPAGDVCFSNASQVRPSPTPQPAGATESVEVDLGAPGVYTVAVKAGDRMNLVDSGSGAETLQGNVSALSNVLTVNTLAADAIAPEQVTDLAAADGPSPETMVNLTWTGVGDDGDLSTADPVLGYDLRVASLPISEVGGDDNFHVPFDEATQVAVVTPATGAGGTTRGVANAYTATGLSPGTTYHFAVKGLDEDPTLPNAPVSNDAGHTTALVTPEAITDLVVADVGANEVTLAWTAPDGGPTSYELRFSLSPIVTAADFDAATAVGGLPTPAAAGTRQAFTVGGLLPETLYYFALVPVRFQTVSGVLTRLAPDPAVVFATTLADTTGNTTQPSAVTDLAVETGTVRTTEARLSWTAPGTAGAPAIRYELRWAHRPIDTASSGEIHVVPVPMLPGAPGVAQEYTLQDLPENTLVYVVLVSYNGSGFVSDASNEVLVHTALRGGMNAVSLPGSLSPNDILTLLGPYAGTCTATGTPTTGSGPVGPCGVGEVTVTAYRFDPGVGANGDFVAMDPAELLAPGGGVFVQAVGTRAVLDLAGLDQASFTPVVLAFNPTLVSNPFTLPVAVADLHVTGSNGYDAVFATAVTDGVVDPVLRFFTREDGVLKYVDVTDADDLLPYRAYFIQLGPGAAPGVTYSLEVPHP